MRLALVAVVVAACSHPTAAPPPQQVTASWHGPEELAHVAFDTPYVFALLDPPSDAVRQKMFGSLDAKVVALLDSGGGVSLDARSSLDPTARAVLGVMDEMRGQDAHLWWENLGFAHNGRWVLYGLGIWPVLRVEVADAPKLHGIAQRAFAAIPKVTEKKLGPVAYWTMVVADYSLVAAVLDREAVVAMVPTAALEASLPKLLGVQHPERSLRDVGEIPALLHKNNWQSTMFGFVDSRRLVDALDRRDTLGPSRALATPACRADLERMAAVVPRIAFGYHRLDVDGFLGEVVMDAPELARDLGHLRTQLPELPTDPLPMIAMLAAVDVDGAIALARGWMKRIGDHPFTCAPLAIVNSGAAGLAKVLATPLPPEAHGLRGALLVVDDAVKEPPSGSGYVVVAGDQIAVAVGELMRKVPGLGAMKIAPDGRPFPLPIALLGKPGLTSAHLAMRAGRAAVAVGDTSEARVTSALAAPNAETTPLFRIVMDVKRLMQRFPGSFKDQDMGAFGTLVMTLDAKSDQLALVVGGVWAR